MVLENDLAREFGVTRQAVAWTAKRRGIKRIHVHGEHGERWVLAVSDEDAERLREIYRLRREARRA